MKKRTAFFVVSALVTSIFFGGCEIDVNKLVGEKSAVESEVSEILSEAEENTEQETDTDVDVSQPDEDEESETLSQNDAAFDTSAYKTVYVSGSASIPVIKDEKDNSPVIGTLSFGDSVSFINSSITDYSFVYSETLSAFGYIADCYLVDSYSEVSYGQIYYSKSNSVKFFEDESGNNEIRNLSKDEGVTVIAMLESGMWRVTDSSETLGYVDSQQLSEEKESEKSKNKSTDKNDKNESKTQSKTESKSESKSESKTESKSSDGRKIGEGEAPTSGYTVYIVDVDVDYLALRSKADSDSDYIIGALYYEEQVYVIDMSGDYWYIYAPSLGMYGYVRGNSDYLYPAVY